jgi:hypothetical protein
MRPGHSACLLVLATWLAGCAVTSGSSRESVGEAVHSISASNTIQIRYQADPVLGPLGLTVETYRREVFISGLAQNEAQRARAVAIARDTPGILDAYFVDTSLPGRRVSRAHYPASREAVWAAAITAIRGAGYQIEEQREGRSLVTAWRLFRPSFVTLWAGTQERVRLALYPHRDIVTVIVVADRLDDGSLAWQIEQEETILRRIREALAAPSPS